MRLSKEIALILLSTCSTGMAYGQFVSASANWGVECTDPKNATPASPDFGFNDLINDLMYVSFGGSGTWTFGDTDNNGVPCFAKPLGTVVVPIAGKSAFSYVNGSIQRYSSNFDDRNLALNFGAPDIPSQFYFNFIEDNNNQVYVADKPNLFYPGKSNRYLFVQQTYGDLLMNLQVELVADAIRYRFNVTNNGTAAHQVGLWYGSGAAMLTDQNLPNSNGQNVSVTGDDQSGSPQQQNAPTNTFRSEKPNYVFVPTTIPPDTDTRFDRTLDQASFPPYIDFLFGQTDAFGYRIETQPSESTDDIQSNKPSTVNQLTLGKAFFLLSPLSTTSPKFPDTILPDTGFLTSAAFIAKVPQVAINPGATQQFLVYVRSTWGQGNYALPFGAVVDAPKVVQVSATNFDGTQSATGIRPNPMKIRVWLDNVGGYGFDQKEFDLNDVRVTLKFKQSGLSFVGGNGTATIPLVPARTDAFTDFTVAADANVVGPIDYSVTIQALAPGPVTKVINGVILFGARARLKLYPGANFVTAPYQFADSSWNAVLAPFIDPNVPGASIQTYTWDPVQQGYVISLNAERGHGAWVIYNSPKQAQTTPTIQNLSGTPTIPPGFNNSKQVVQLGPGWNMIGDPFNYPVPLNQLLGVSAANPKTVYTFEELVKQGAVSNFVAFWDPVSQSYQYVDGSAGSIQPNTGYWINVLQQADITIEFPELYLPGISDSTRSAANGSGGPTGKNLWQTELSVRQGLATDSNNYFGTVSKVADANRYRIYKAPMSPTQTVEVALQEVLNSKTQLVARSYVTSAAKYQWKVIVDNRKLGPVTLSLPQLAAVPATFSVHLTDLATNTTQDMRKVNNYTYTAVTTGRRNFVISVGPDSGPNINYVTAQLNEYNRMPVVVANYYLKAAATTTVTVLNSQGAVVSVLHTNRNEVAGSHYETWNLHSSAGYLMPPGTYVIQVSSTLDGNSDSKTAAITLR